MGDVQAFWTTALVSPVDEKFQPAYNGEFAAMTIPVFVCCQSVYAMSGNGGNVDDLTPAQDAPGAASGGISLMRIGPRPAEPDDPWANKPPLPPNGWLPHGGRWPGPGDTIIVLNPRFDRQPKVGDTMPEITLDGKGNLVIIIHTVTGVQVLPADPTTPNIPGNVIVTIDPPWDGGINAVIPGGPQGPVIIRPQPQPPPKN